MNERWKKNHGGSTLHRKTQKENICISCWAGQSWRQEWQWGWNSCGLTKKGTGQPQRSEERSVRSSTGTAKEPVTTATLWHRSRSKAKPGDQASGLGTATLEAGIKQAQDEGLSWNASSDWRWGSPKEVPCGSFGPSSFSAGCPRAMGLLHARASHNHCKPSAGAGEGCALSFDQ